MPRPDSGFLSGILAGVNQFKQTRQYYEQMESTNLQQEATRAQMAAFKQQQADYMSPTAKAEKDYDEYLRRNKAGEDYKSELAGTERERRRVYWEANGIPEGGVLDPDYNLSWIPGAGRAGKGSSAGGYTGQIKPSDMKTLTELMENSIANLGFTKQNFEGIDGLPEDVLQKAMAQLTGGIYKEINPDTGKEEYRQIPYTDQAGAITTLYAGLLETDPQILAFARRMEDPSVLRSTIATMASRRSPLAEIQREVQRLSFEAVPSEQTGLGEAAERLAAQPIASIESIGPYAKFIAGTMVSDVPGLEDKGTALQDESFRTLLSINEHNINKSLEYLKAENFASGTIQAFIKFLLRTGKLTRGTQGETQGIPAPNIGSRP